jgi:hypothetical protein
MLRCGLSIPTGYFALHQHEDNTSTLGGELPFAATRTDVCFGEKLAPTDAIPDVAFSVL